MNVLIGVTVFVLALVAVSRIAQKLHVSAPLLLMLVGLGASFLPFIDVPRLRPEFILLWILPPLLHAAALNTSLIDFRRNLAAIGWLSIGLVVATALTVGIVASALLGLPLPVGIALGAVVGSRFGGGSGRDFAAIAGAVGGAVAGNAIQNNNRIPNVSQTYRVTVQLDNGGARAYDVPATGELRIGDRGRIQNTQLFRY